MKKPGKRERVARKKHRRGIVYDSAGVRSKLGSKKMRIYIRKLFAPIFTKDSPVVDTEN